MKRAANVNTEFDNFGSSVVIGDDAVSWDFTTRKHAKRYLAIQDRMVYAESPDVGWLAPLKYGGVIGQDHPYQEGHVAPAGREQCPVCPNVLRTWIAQWCTVSCER